MVKINHTFYYLQGVYFIKKNLGICVYTILLDLLRLSLSIIKQQRLFLYLLFVKLVFLVETITQNNKTNLK